MSVHRQTSSSNGTHWVLWTMIGLNCLAMLVAILLRWSGVYAGSSETYSMGAFHLMALVYALTMLGGCAAMLLVFTVVLGFLRGSRLLAGYVVLTSVCAVITVFVLGIVLMV